VQAMRVRGAPILNPAKAATPSGRPKGARSKAMVAIEALLENEAEALTRKVIELAKESSMPPPRLRFERLLPPTGSRCPLSMRCPKAGVRDEFVSHSTNAPSPINPSRTRGGAGI
jgi:hypothetical protein